MEEFLRVAHKNRVRVKIASQLRGEHWFGAAKVEVLAPSNFDQNRTTNNNSLVLKITYGLNSALWPGDIESEAEDQARKGWESEVVKAPHHGSKTSSSAYFINQVKAKQVIYCTAPDNQFGFPHQEVKKRWQEAGAQAWDTAQHGLLQLFMTGTRVITKPFLVSN
jgi:competence protein ComEC